MVSDKSNDPKYNKNHSYRRETARCFVSLNILLSCLRSFEMLSRACVIVFHCEKKIITVLGEICVSIQILIITCCNKNIVTGTILK